MFTKYFIIFIFYGVGDAQIVYPLDISHGLGRRFDGIGGLSAGASSKLLVNYPQEQRNEILDYLFKPNFGASLHILKVEIGGDAQSTDGTEASHMHYSWDENYNRGYEWWLMKEAKKRNPNIKLYGLPWGFPGWVANFTETPYAYPTRLATYIVNWVKGAKSVHNLDIDYIGIWNERMYDINYVKILRKSLNAANLSAVSIVAADYFGWKIADDILNDKEFGNAVFGIGVHYPGTTSSADALKTGKPLWSSEDYSTYDNVVGGGCWARLLNMNYVNGSMTSTISWSLIASWYSDLPFGGDGLMTAVEPWSGYYEIASPIWVSAHTAQFTSPGWTYLPHGKGVSSLKFGGSFVSLLSPDKNNLSIIIETISHNKSICIRPKLPPYTVFNQEVIFKLEGELAKFEKLYVWYSKLGSIESSSTLFQKRDPIMLKNGTMQLIFGIDEIWTLTTSNIGYKAETFPPSSRTFPVPYFDDFEKAPIFSEPKNLSPQMRSFEVLRNETTKNQFIRQTSLDRPVKWCACDDYPQSLAVIGSGLLQDIVISVNFNLNLANRSDGVFLAARIKQAGCSFTSAKIDGVFFNIWPFNNTFAVNYDLKGTTSITSGKLGSGVIFEDWNSMSLIIQEGLAFGHLNGMQIFAAKVPNSPSMGFVGLGTPSLGLADFDSLYISDPQGPTNRQYLKFKVNLEIRG